MNRKMFLAFRSMEQELKEDDPDMEAILYSMMATCREHEVRFMFEYDPAMQSEPIRIIYHEIMWSFGTLDDAIAWVVDFAVKSMRDDGTFLR